MAGCAEPGRTQIVIRTSPVCAAEPRLWRYYVDPGLALGHDRGTEDEEAHGVGWTWLSASAQGTGINAEPALAIRVATASTGPR